LLYALRGIWLHRLELQNGLLLKFKEIFHVHGVDIPWL